jgi:hypothetical protein
MSILDSSVTLPVRNATLQVGSGRKQVSKGAKQISNMTETISSGTLQVSKTDKFRPPTHHFCFQLSEFQLLPSCCWSKKQLLCAATKFVGVNARNENSAGRSASYIVTGTLGSKRTGVMHKGKVRWEKS